MDMGIPPVKAMNLHQKVKPLKSSFLIRGLSLSRVTLATCVVSLGVAFPAQAFGSARVKGKRCFETSEPPRRALLMFQT